MMMLTKENENNDVVLYERQLLLQVARGDEGAFKSIFERYRDRFYAAAFKMTRSQDLAEEIVQEVFVSLWMRRSALEHIESPSAYLFAIVYNSISAHLKKIAKERQLKQCVRDIAVESECSTERIMEEKENEATLHEIIRQLPTQQQLIYQLSRQDGLSRNEIAERLQLSPNTVKNHLLRAMKFIRGNLSKALPFLVGIFF